MWGYCYQRVTLIGSLLMEEAWIDISFKFYVFKTFLFIPAAIIGGQLGDAIGVTLGFLLVQIINTILNYFVMIKPVLEPGYRDYLLSQKQQAAGVSGRVKKVLRRRFRPRSCLAKVTCEGKLRNFDIVPEFHKFVRFLGNYDAIIQVGGANYVDLYGLTHFEYPLCAFIANKPVDMIGHSVGPFHNPDFNELANYAMATLTR